MKIYGFDELSIVTGDLKSYDVDKGDYLRFSSMIESNYGLEYSSSRFIDARAALVNAMQSQNVDGELIAIAKTFKAADIPVYG